MSYYCDLVIQWADRNQLLLKVAKTKSIVIGSYYTNKLLANPIKGVILNGNLIKYEESVMTLGVVLDDKLNWKEHVTAISKKANSLRYRLNFFRKLTTFDLQKHLIESLLFPLDDYCLLVMSNLSDELDLKLHRIINSGVDYVRGLRKCEYITLYRSTLGLLTTSAKCKYFGATVMYKLFKNNRPDYLLRRYIANQSQRPIRGHRMPLCIR